MTASAVSAVPLGIAFGVILERVGLGDPRVITKQLLGRDFTVIRVMFAAIVVAMLGVAWLGASGVIDPANVATPPTDVGAQVVGAVLFGGGFALAALCPGTACVAASSGRRDGVAAVGGLFVGTALTPVFWPVFRGVAAGAPREGARLTTDLHLPVWLVATAITVLWLVASMVARRVESTPGNRWWLPTRLETAALVLAVVLIGADRSARLSPMDVGDLARTIAAEGDHVDAVELATWIKERRDGLRVIDVREQLDSAAYIIPGASVLPIDRLGELRVGAGEHIVLYSDGGAHAAQAWVLLRARGVSDVRVLKDGMAAWEDEVLNPVRPTTADDSARSRFERAQALALWFGGHPRAAGVPNDAPRTPASRPRRRKTC